MISTFSGLAAFFGVAGLTEPDASGAPSTLRVLSGGQAVPGAPWVEVEPFLAGALHARGLPSRFRISPDNLSFDLPAGEPLLYAEAGEERRVIACRTPDGAVVLGFDPARAIERWLLASAPVSGLPRPAGGWRRAMRRAGLFAPVRASHVWGGGVDVDALRFACWSLLEEVVTRSLPAPAPFWPHGRRAAFALTFDLFDLAGWIAWRRGRDRGAVWSGGRGAVTCFIGRRLLRARPDVLAELSLEGVGVGLLEEGSADRVWRPSVSRRAPQDVRCVRLLGGGAAPAEGSPAAALPSSSTVGWDAATARGVVGTVFPYLREGRWELPVACPARPAAGPPLWGEVLGGLGRLGGVFVARVPLAGRLSAREAAALGALVDSVWRDGGFWSATVPQVAAWWSARASAARG